MFNYYEKKKELIKLRDKIYKKQKKTFNIMHRDKICFENPNIKRYLDEINLLEEIFDIKKYILNMIQKTIGIIKIFSQYMIG